MNPSSSTFLHKPLVDNITKTRNRSIDFEESNVPQDVEKPEKSYATELPTITITIGQVQVDLFPEELPLKKSRSNFSIHFFVKYIL